MSGFVSLTLTPMLCARVLKAHDPHHKPNFVLRWFEAMFDSWLRAYEWTLDRVLAYKSVMLVVTLATLGATLWLYLIVPKGFFPQEDTGFLSGTTELRPTRHSRRWARVRRFLPIFCGLIPRSSL